MSITYKAIHDGAASRSQPDSRYRIVTWLVIVVAFAGIMLGGETFREVWKTRSLDLSTTHAREEYVFRFWKDKDLTDAQAASVVGTFMGETRENDPLDPSTVGGWHNKAFGIEQCLGDRRTNLFEFAKKEGVDLFKSSFADRLRVENEYAYFEFQTSETEAWQKLVKAKTVDAATDAMARFERWAGWKNGEAGSEAGTHYLWAHKIYRMAKSRSFDKRKTLVP